SRQPAQRFVTGAAGLSQLRAEFRLCRHLLEQPPSSAACHGDGKWRDSLGQPASVVLAVAVSVCHGVDGGEPFQRAAYGTLWRGAADGGYRIFSSAAGDHTFAGPGLDFENGGWDGLEGQAFTGAVCGCDWCDDGFALDLGGDFRGGGVDLVDSGPADREGRV